MFWQSVPKERGPEDEEYLASILKSWDEPFGDKRQELVFIGQGLDKEAFYSGLNECLLTDSEMHGGPKFWQKLPGPFPEWEEAH